MTLSWRQCVAAASLVLVGVGHASGQGLGDLAKRTDAERKAKPEGSRRYELTAAAPVPLTPLDKDVVDLYVRARMEMAHMWRKDRGLFQRLHTGATNARSFDESCQALETEPEMVALLKRYGYSTLGFFSVMASIQRATTMAEGYSGYRELTPVETANYHFAGRHTGWLSSRRGQILRAEGGWTIWP